MLTEQSFDLTDLTDVPICGQVPLLVVNGREREPLLIATLRDELGEPEAEAQELAGRVEAGYRRVIVDLRLDDHPRARRPVAEPDLRGRVCHTPVRALTPC